MYYPRSIFSRLEKQLETPEIIVLTGMRRVGKTTLLRMLFDSIKSNNKVFLDIENPINQKIFEELDFDNIQLNLKQLSISPKQKAYVFLDEIGAMPQIVKAIKYLYDHYNIKFFLTGSSSFYLKNLFPESLAGRKVIFELYPLDFAEFLQFKQIKKTFVANFADKDRNKNKIAYEKLIRLYDEYLTYGGFPQVVLADSIEQKRLALEDIFKSYFEKDVTNLADFKNMNLFRDMLLLLLSRVGSKVNISRLSSEIGISRETVYSYIAFLQGTYFIDLVPPFTKSIDRQVSSLKKLYLCDNGFISLFSKVDLGSLFENAVYLNLRKYGQLHYYQKRSGAEIDFIQTYLNGHGTFGLEVKLTGTNSDLKRLIRISRNLKLSNCYIITKSFHKQKGFIPAIEF